MTNCPNPVRVAAHRGNSRYFPENTMAAYRSALTLPVDQIEIDLHMTKDGEIVMLHDHDVDRTTDGHGPVRSFMAREIRALDAGSWKDSSFAGERIPLFTEFLDLMREHPEMTVNVELKDYPEGEDPDWAYRSADKSLALLEAYGMRERVWINCFSAPLLEYVDRVSGHGYRLHGYYPFDLLRGPRTRDPYDYLHCACLFGSGERPVRDKADFQYALSRGVEPWVYFPDDSEASYAGAVENGALLITANDPAKCVRFLSERGLHRGFE